MFSTSFTSRASYVLHSLYLLVHAFFASCVFCGLHLLRSVVSTSCVLHLLYSPFLTFPASLLLGCVIRFLGSCTLHNMHLSVPILFASCTFTSADHYRALHLSLYIFLIFYIDYDGDAWSILYFSKYSMGSMCSVSPSSKPC